uniref:ABC transmembrane type-1 domain-containing protein n=1 Tax=Ascaris lumbricoides TaxID=6252 RepID=A0A0M3IUB2_ASCLU
MVLACLAYFSDCFAGIISAAVLNRHHIPCINKNIIEDFLEDYVVQVQPLYAEYLVNRRFIEIGGETKILFTYANSLALLVSYALTTG